MTPGRRRHPGHEGHDRAAGLGDPGVRAGLVVATLAAAGLAALGLAWRGAAATINVWQQVPFVLSGGIGGLALTGLCLGVLAVHAERRASAGDRQWLESVVSDAAETAEILPSALIALAPLVPTLVTNGRTIHRADCRMAAGKDLRNVSVGEWGRLRACRICRPGSVAPAR